MSHAGSLRRFLAVAETIDDRSQCSTGEGFHQVRVTGFYLSGHRQHGYAPFPPTLHCGYRFQFFTVTVVPPPSAETMSTSSISLRVPGRPNPRLPEVE